MIDRSFIEKIEEMSKNEIVVEKERPYSTKELHPISDPEPTALNIATLTGIVDYLAHNPDGLSSPDILVHVAGPKCVGIFSKLDPQWMGRNSYLQAICNPPSFQWGQMYPVESFITALQSLFVQDEATASILKVVGNLTDGKTTNFSDDGVTQQVTAKAGIARVENVPVPNPVELAPFRTFMEVTQPSSRFVLRIKSQNETPMCALFEADGKNWELLAIKNIRDWLSDKIDKNITILA